MIDKTLQDAENRMKKTLTNTKNDLGKVRTGRANLSMLDSVKVDYYGSMTPLNQVANLGVPEPRLIVIQPWDKSMLGTIEKAIQKADLGITRNNDGNVIRLPIPRLTEERRKDLVKVLHKMAEDGKVAIRNIRRDAIEDFRDAEKKSDISEDDKFAAEEEIQELTDTFVKKIDDLIKLKEKEVMEV